MPYIRCEHVSSVANGRLCDLLLGGHSDSGCGSKQARRRSVKPSGR
jgi:hypothetical protein